MEKYSPRSAETLANFITEQYLAEPHVFTVGARCKKDGKEEECCTAFQSPIWKDGYCFYHSPLRSQYEYLKRAVALLGEPSALPGPNEYHEDWTALLHAETERAAKLMEGRHLRHLPEEDDEDHSATSPLPRRSSKGAGIDPHHPKSSPASPVAPAATDEKTSAPQGPALAQQTLAKIQDSLTPRASKRGLHIVFDLDETLVFTSVGGKAVHKDANTFLLGNYRVAIRPYAIDLLKQLRDQGFPVYVLSSASEDYCVGICNYFNRISPGLILNAASCRIHTMKGVIVMQKHFKMVLDPAIDPDTAMAIDNRRRAWDRGLRDQVMIVPDYNETDSGSAAVLMLILSQIRSFYALYSQRSNTSVADVLAEFYETREKNRIAEFATAVTFHNPHRPQWSELEKELVHFLG